MKALLFWPDQPLLSLLVLLVIAVPFLYAARAPMQDFIGRLTRALSNPLRLGSHWLARTATRLHRATVRCCSRTAAVSSSSASSASSSASPRWWSAICRGIRRSSAS